MNGVFVTGTDTGCGKTRVSVALMQVLQQRGLQVMGMKPVAAGAELVDGQLRNEDALLLQQQASRAVAYGLVNPYVFEAAIAPHLAAAKSGVAIDPDVIVESCRQLAESADVLVVEGAGGWRVPLGEDVDLSDLPKKLQLPVILVVGMKLGCINHARLTAESIQQDGLDLVGWIANQIDPDMPSLQANIETLRQYLPAPCLGVVPFQAQNDVSQFAVHLDAELLPRQVQTGQ
ncbi:MAG: dethiobiotin synthase [Chromatiales bacterium]|jgi:dethiobiotin synthetase